MCVLGTAKGCGIRVKIDKMSEKAEEDIFVDSVELEFEESDSDEPKDKFVVPHCFIFQVSVCLLYFRFYRHWHAITLELLYNGNAGTVFAHYIFKYFQYQFRNKTLPEGADPLSPMHRTELQKVFFSYLTIASLIPTTLANFANLMIKDWYVRQISFIHKVFRSSFV